MLLIVYIVGFIITYPLMLRVWLTMDFINGTPSREDYLAGVPWAFLCCIIWFITIWYPIIRFLVNRGIGFGHTVGDLIVWWAKQVSRVK